MANGSLLTPEEFKHWLATASPGDRVTYYTGYLAKDRVVAYKAPTGVVLYVDNPPVSILADLAWDAYENGKVFLVQGKIDTNLYYYLAVRRNRPSARAKDRPGAYGYHKPAGYFRYLSGQRPISTPLDARGRT